MIKTTYQKPEIRDANDNIIQQGAFGKNTALANATNDGWIDYVANDLEFLYDLAKDEIVPVPSLPASGQMNKTYLLTTTGVSYRWSGTQWVAVSSSEAVGRAESAANLAEQWATKTSGSVDGTEYSAKYYAEQAEASADDAQDVADDMADHLVQIDKNTGGVAKNSKRISNIEKLLQGNLYDYDTDDDVAYVKTVPSGALPYAGIEQIGGKTVVWNQDVPLTTAWNKNRCTLDLVDGVYEVTCTSNSYNFFGIYIRDITVISGHKYLYSCDFNANTTNNLTVFEMYTSAGLENVTELNSWLQYRKIFTASQSAESALNIALRYGNASDVTVGDKISVRNPMRFDLTLMFGAGNEPSTVEQFREMFPADYYPYNSGELLSAGVTEVVSKKADTTTIGTYPIPAEIQALDGYGWSTGTAYNYVDFERKVFVKRVGRVDLGSLTWKVSGAGNMFAVVSDMKASASITEDILINPKYSHASVTSGNMTYWINSNTQTLYIRDESYVTAYDFKSAMSGVYAYYQLATPIETDISQYLTDNLIEVGAGGTLTFPNSNGDNYRIPVPSEETYMINLQEAVSNG